MATFATSRSKVGTSNRVMLVVPTILTAVPLVPEMYSATFSFTVKAVGVCPLLCQQGDGHAHVDHHEAFSGLAPGLVTPCDLPGSNTDGDVWLISLLLLGFGQLRPRLGHLEPAHRHTYLLDDQGIRRLKQGTQWQIGYWGLWHSGWRHDDRHGQLYTRRYPQPS